MRAFKVTAVGAFWKLIIPGQSSQLFAALSSVNHLNVESEEFLLAIIAFKCVSGHPPSVMVYLQCFA